MALVRVNYGTDSDSTFSSTWSGASFGFTATSGNLLVMFVAHGAGSDPNINTPSGWTAVGSQGNTNQLNYQVFYKISDGTESSVTLTLSSSWWWYGGAMCVVEISGHDATTPIASYVYNGGDPASSVALSSISPSGSNAMYLAFPFFDDDDHSAFTYTNSVSVGTYSEDFISSGLSTGFGYKDITDGSSVSTTIGKTGGLSDGFVGVGIMVNAGAPSGTVNASSESLTWTDYNATVDDGKITPEVIQTVGDETGYSPTSSITINSSDGWATPTVGNIIICYVLVYNVNESSYKVPTHTTPSGFTHIATDYSQYVDSPYYTTHSVAAYYKVATGSETSVTGEFTNAGNVWYGTSMILKEVSNLTTIEGYGTNSGVSTTSLAITASSLNGAVDKFYDVGVGSDVYPANTISYNNSFVEDIETGGVDVPELGSAHLMGSTETSKSVTVTFGASNATAVGILIAFNVATSGSGSVDVNATTESLTWTDYNASITKSLDVNTTTESLTWTDYSASITKSLDITSTSEALTWTEYSANISTSGQVDVNATTEELFWTDYNASITGALDVNATTESLTWTDHNASISTIGSVDIDTTTEALTWTDYDALISTIGSVDIDTTTEELTWTDYDATIQLQEQTSGYSGGWYRRNWEITSKQVKKQREELGITKKEASQIARVIKKVGKAEIDPNEARDTVKRYFEQEALEYDNRHQRMMTTLLRFIDNIDRVRPLQLAHQARLNAIQKEKQEREDRELKRLLKIEYNRVSGQEEKDLIMIVSMLSNMFKPKNVIQKPKPVSREEKNRERHTREIIEHISMLAQNKQK